MRILTKVSLVVVLLMSCGISSSFAQWVQTSGPGGGSIHSLVAIGTKLFAGTSSFTATSGGVYLSTNNGTSWTAVNSGLTNEDVNSLAVNGANLFAGTGGGGVFLSTNNGTSWTAVNSGLTYQNIDALLSAGGNLYAGTFGGLSVSTDNGTSWTTAADSGLTSTDFQVLLSSGAYLFAGTSSGLFRSSNSGASWTTVDSGLTNTYVFSMAVNGSNLVA